MDFRPLPISQLPLAPFAQERTSPEDIIHPAGTTAPEPSPRMPGMTVAGEDQARRLHSFPNRGRRPSPHHSRTQTAPAVTRATSSSAEEIAARLVVTTTVSPLPGATHSTPSAAATDRTAAHPLDGFEDAYTRAPFSARSQWTPPPKFEPVNPEAFDVHDHPLAIRVPLDIFHFFPITVTLAAIFASLSGLLAGKIVNHLLGGNTTPALFVGIYLSLFLLNLVSHYFSAKGQLFFTCRPRFLRLLVANAFLLSPHFIAYSILISAAGK